MKKMDSVFRSVTGGHSRSLVKNLVSPRTPHLVPNRLVPTLILGRMDEKVDGSSK